jgi:hypothetical protein
VKWTVIVIVIVPSLLALVARHSSHLSSSFLFIFGHSTFICLPFFRSLLSPASS